MRWIWMAMGALIAVPLVATPAYLIGSAKGKAAVRNELVERRLATKEKIDELDNAVFSADESRLCDMLGGC